MKCLKDSFLKDSTENSWYNEVKRILEIYDLPSAYELFVNPPSKNEWKAILKEEEGKSPETDSIKFKISSKTHCGKKDSTKRHHHRHHKRQPGEQQFPKQVVTG